MTIRTAVHDALASHATEYELVRELHAVPPHAVYEVIVDGTRAVCKLETHPEGDPETEGRVLEYVARETSIPVPRVLAIGEDHFVAEWHDGVPDPEGDDPIDEPYARAMGTGLARLHEETARSFDRSGSFESDTAVDGLALDGHEAWTDTVCDLLEDCRAFLEPYGYDDVAAEAIAFFRERPDAFDGVDSPVLIHGNFLPAHVGVADDTVSCVLDFEHAMVGPAEYDYWATVLPTFESAGADDPDGTLRAAFDDGYEAVRPFPDGLERRRPLHWVVLSVTYLRSLYLQREWDSRADADRHAEHFAAFVRETLERY